MGRKLRYTAGPNAGYTATPPGQVPDSTLFQMLFYFLKPVMSSTIVQILSKVCRKLCHSRQMGKGWDPPPASGRGSKNLFVGVGAYDDPFGKVTNFPNVSRKCNILPTGRRGRRPPTICNSDFFDKLSGRDTWCPARCRFHYPSESRRSAFLSTSSTVPRVSLTMPSLWK